MPTYNIIIITVYAVLPAILHLFVGYKGHGLISNICLALIDCV